MPEPRHGRSMGLAALALASCCFGSATAASAQGVPTPLWVPDDPPRAGLIQVSAPSAAGEVTVTGGPGAAPGATVVALVTLDTGHFMPVAVAPDGSFTGTLYAPPGTSILVKSDPTGRAIQRLIEDGIQRELRGGANSLSTIPATILRVPDAVPAPLGASGAGLTRFAPTGESPLPAFTFDGSLSAEAVQPGGTLGVTGVIRMVSPVLQGAGAMEARLTFGLERLSGPDGTGAHARNSYASIFLTPTGLPIERMPRFFNDGLDQFRAITMSRPAPDRAEAVVDMTLTLPTQFLPGYYRPYLDVNFTGVPVEAPPLRTIIQTERAQRRPINKVRLPVVRVGNPAPPRLFWTLLTDTLSNGTRGTRAVEDRERFGLAPRILTQSETFIVPRVDPRTGQPHRYRLEPYVPTVCLDDQAPPGPPLIPLRLPSGRLAVRIQRPDGSAETIGPAPFAQLRLKSLADGGGNLLDGGGGHITDACELSTLDPRFEVTFAQDGRHVITLEGAVEDIWGTTWSGGGTYEVHVARTLALDTAVLPGTPFEVGDAVTPGLVVSPAVPAEVEVRFRLAPDSDPARMMERTVRGRASRFGYFHPAGGGIPLDRPGEYRVDVTATYRDEQGALWMGARTWGGVVAPRSPATVAHGRRGIDSEPRIGQQWFLRTQTGVAIGGNHVPFAFHSGDVMWLQDSDSAIPLVTVQDLGGSLSALLRDRSLDVSGRFNQVPLTGPGTFDERAAVGELPLFSSRPDGLDPHLDASRVDLWGYSYRSVQRPLVRVREEIGEDQLPPPYWRFQEQYAGQIGVGPNGDLPDDIKFQYAATVLRGPAVGQAQYAIYGSLFVLVPNEDPFGGTRTLPPFQGNGGGPSGGPIMVLRGRPIDLFVHLTGVRPGSVLELGDTFALAGAVGPPLPAVVSYTVTLPDGQRRPFNGRANRVGYYYRPQDDFTVTRPGLYQVDLRVDFDGLTSAGQVTAPLPTGDVLGTTSGRFYVYVVPRGSAALAADQPREASLPAPAALTVAATIPPAMVPARAHATALMPGFVLETLDLPPAGTFSYRYDPVSLARDFRALDVTRFGRPVAADAVTISLYAEGTGPRGEPVQSARVLTLHGTDLFDLPPPAGLPALLEATTDRGAYRRGETLILAVHYAQGSDGEALDAYVGLRRPDGGIESLLPQGGRFGLVTTGTTPEPAARGPLPAVEFSGSLATRVLGAGDPAGTWTAFALLVRAGQSPLDQRNWLGARTVTFTVAP